MEYNIHLITESQKWHDLLPLMGDFNDKVGMDIQLWGGVLFSFGIGTINDNVELVRNIPNSHPPCYSKLLFDMGVTFLENPA